MGNKNPLYATMSDAPGTLDTARQKEDGSSLIAILSNDDTDLSTDIIARSKEREDCLNPLEFALAIIHDRIETNQKFKSDLTEPTVPAKDRLIAYLKKTNDQNQIARIEKKSNDEAYLLEEISGYDESIDCDIDVYADMKNLLLCIKNEASSLNIESAYTYVLAYHKRELHVFTKLAIRGDDEFHDSPYHKKICDLILKIPQQGSILPQNLEEFGMLVYECLDVESSVSGHKLFLNKDKISDFLDQHCINYFDSQIAEQKRQFALLSQMITNVENKQSPKYKNILKNIAKSQSDLSSIKQSQSIIEIKTTTVFSYLKNAALDKALKERRVELESQDFHKCIHSLYINMYLKTKLLIIDNLSSEIEKVSTEYKKIQHNADLLPKKEKKVQERPAEILETKALTEMAGPEIKESEIIIHESNESIIKGLIAYPKPIRAIRAKPYAKSAQETLAKPAAKDALTMNLKEHNINTYFQTYKDDTTDFISRIETLRQIDMNDGVASYLDFLDYYGFKGTHSVEGKKRAFSIESPKTGVLIAKTYHRAHKGSEEKRWPSWRCALHDLLVAAQIIAGVVHDRY
ncbi:MAG: hypothetical protein V4544_05585 [Pseudomonadota bacterium]